VSAAPEGHPIFTRLFDEAERARWKMSDLAWGAIARDRVTAEERARVREIIASEATTFSATQRFLLDFADDVAFSNWLSIWFYEETKHPQVLVRWLAAFDEHVDDAAMRRARVTAPFMRSKTATLVTNIISEMVAAARYLRLSKTTAEPVLAQIARNLAGDEARHAASFFVFARERIARSATPDDERRDALKVLYLWSNASGQNRHPVNLLAQDGMEVTQRRVFRMIGLLIDQPLTSAAEVVERLREVGGRMAEDAGR
jgi:hypothetical protein